MANIILPVAPVRPGCPVAPVGPICPGCPGFPGTPFSPGCPGTPLTPGSPGSPAGPVLPVSPRPPVAPRYTIKMPGSKCKQRTSFYSSLIYLFILLCIALFVLVQHKCTHFLPLSGTVVFTIHCGFVFWRENPQSHLQGCVKKCTYTITLSELYHKNVLKIRKCSFETP